MSVDISVDPPIPLEVEEAAQSGKLVVFVGAGISRLIDCPSWDGFADRVIDQLVPKYLNYYQKSQILSIRDPRKRLSIAKIVAERTRTKIDYEQIFSVSPKPDNIYANLNSYNCTFVTTNYEKYLRPDCRLKDSEDSWRFYRREDLIASKLDVIGNVIHLHGCVSDPTSMVITTRDYLEHYSNDAVQSFLAELFAKKTVLFLGYGLEEVEVLEYILNRGKASHSKTPTDRHFILQGFFNAEISLFQFLRDFYRDSFGVGLIGFPKDFMDFAQQKDILATWGSRLRFEGMTLSDELAHMMEELDD